jgi:hypothetical protein
VGLVNGDIGDERVVCTGIDRVCVNKKGLE